MNKYAEFVGFSDPIIDRGILHDSRSVRRTQTLFVDVNVNKKYEPLYTMRDQDHKGYISAYQIFMHSVDEYDAALKLVGSLEHWEKLCDLKWFREGDDVRNFSGIEKWRLDMTKRDVMMAKKTIMKQISSSNDVSASRALLNMHKKEEAAKQPKKTPAQTKAEQDKDEKAAKIRSVVSNLPRRGD